MAFISNRTEDYYTKLIDLQEKLRKSEEERLKLEIKFIEMGQNARDERERHFRRLRAQYKRFLEEDRRRQDRNEGIRRCLDRIDGRVSMLVAKTERFRLLKHQYNAFLQRICLKSGELPDEKLKNLLEKEDNARARLPFSRENESGDFWRSNEEEIRPNYANSVADDIIHTIYTKSDTIHPFSKEVGSESDIEEISISKTAKKCEECRAEPEDTSSPNLNLLNENNETGLKIGEIELQEASFKVDEEINGIFKTTLKEEGNGDSIRERPQVGKVLFDEHEIGSITENNDPISDIKIVENEDKHEIVHELIENDEMVNANIMEQTQEISQPKELIEQKETESLDKNTNELGEKAEITVAATISAEKSAEEAAPAEQYPEYEQYMPQYDEHGQYVPQYDENGQLIGQYGEYDENGQLIGYDQGQYDDQGQFIEPKYDESGQLVGYDPNQVQYDENGQIVQAYDGPYGQYDVNGQIMQEQYDVNGQLMGYDGSQVQYDENGQIVGPEGYYNAEYEAEAPLEHERVEEAGNKDEKQGVEARSEEKIGGNVMEMLNTDSEVSAKEVEVSHDSDFDFSNATLNN